LAYDLMRFIDNLV